MSKRILVVDDNPDIVDLLKNRLEFHHFDVSTAMDGREAVTKAKQEQPDLVLMDITMPNMDGGEAVRSLRAEISVKHLPVIFVTATLTKEDGSMIEKGIHVDDERFDVVAKPINPQELLDKINEQLGVS